MGKKSKKPSYPEYSGGSVVVNGRTVASASKQGNNIVTNYQMSNYEKNMFNALEKGMSDSVSKLFDITDQQKTAWNEQLNALKAKGVKNINDIYTPIETDLRNDIANRFGNLDNSVFMDKLNDITDKKSDAVASLSNSLAATEQDLYTNELNNRMNTISFLNNLHSGMNNNILNYTNAASTNAMSGNSFNTQAYQAQSGNTLSGIGNYINMDTIASIISMFKYLK